MLKFRASLSQRGDEIKGTVEFSTDPIFNLEAFLMIAERFAKRAGRPTVELLEDLAAMQRAADAKDEDDKHK